MTRKPKFDYDYLYDVYVNQGMSSRDIGKLHSVTNVTVLNYLRKYDIPIRQDQAIPCPDEDKLRELCEDSSLSNEDIAAHFGIGTTLLHKWIKKAGIDRRAIRNNEKEPPPKSVLDNEYSLLRMSPIELGIKYGVSNVTIMNWLRMYRIPLRTRSQAQSIASVKVAETCLEKYGHPYPMMLTDYKQSWGEAECKGRLNYELGINLKTNRGVLDGFLELDGYDPEHNIAIEFCGLYWHSEKGGKDRLYHYKKWKECKDKGIRLFTIYDNEWRDNQDKIVNYLGMSLGLCKTTIPARKTEFVRLEKHQARKLCDENHLQGGTRFTDAFGLMFEENLVSCMTFGPHHRDTSILVMNRFCSMDGVRVQGGASKLMKNASEILDRDIVTWSDNRWSDGKVYEAMGCVFDRHLMPEYVWTDFMNVYSKQSRRKSVTGQPTEMTEKEYNESLGMSRIWDCGKIRWIYPRK